MSKVDPRLALPLLTMLFAEVGGLGPGTQPRVPRWQCGADAGLHVRGRHRAGCEANPRADHDRRQVVGRDRLLEIVLLTFDDGVDIYTVPGSGTQCLPWPTGRGKSLAQWPGTGVRAVAAA
jgi:hypothetical protein